MDEHHDYKDTTFQFTDKDGRLNDKITTLIEAFVHGRLYFKTDDGEFAPIVIVTTSESTLVMDGDEAHELDDAGNTINVFHRDDTLSSWDLRDEF